MEICQYDEIIWDKKVEICQLALDGISYHADSIVQLGLEDGKLYTAHLSSNTTENPQNKLVEVFRLNQNFDMEYCSGCSYCDDCTDDCKACSEEKLKECAIASLLEDFIDEYDEIVSNVGAYIQECGYDLI